MYFIKLSRIYFITLIIYSLFIQSYPNEKTISIDTECNEKFKITFSNNFTCQTTVVLVQGSGPLDRNGNSISLKSDNLKQLKQQLFMKGYNILTFDKRGVGYNQSLLKDEKSMSYENSIDDLNTVFGYLERKKKPFSIVAHSDGVLQSLITVNRHKYDYLDGLVLISGTKLSADSLIKLQLQNSNDSEYNEICSKIDSLKKGNFNVNFPVKLYSVFRESVFLYLYTWMNFKPEDELKSCRYRTLVLHGDCDLQVSLDVSLCNVKENNSIILKNTNHLFKNVNNFQENINSYENPNIPLSSDLIVFIDKFLRKK